MSTIAPETWLTWEYEAVPASVRAARESVAQFAAACGLDSGRVDDVRLAVSEAATNVILHACGDGGGATFEVRVHCEDDSLEILIEDDGPGLDRRSDRAGLGMGMELIRQVSDHAGFDVRDGGGTRVLLRFDLPSAACGAGPSASSEGWTQSGQCPG